MKALMEQAHLLSLISKVKAAPTPEQKKEAISIARYVMNYLGMDANVWMKIEATL